MAGALLLGCTPLSFLRANPVVVPSVPPPEPLSVPSLDVTDCGRFLLEGSEWKELPWDGGPLDMVVPGDLPPIIRDDGRVRCRAVVIAPGWWVQAREARERHPKLVAQLSLWADYATAQAAYQQAESERLAELVKLARRRQWEAFGVGVAIGGAVTAGVIAAGAIGSR